MKFYIYLYKIYIRRDGAIWEDFCLCDVFVVVQCCGRLCAWLQVSKLWFESFLQVLRAQGNSFHLTFSTSFTQLSFL